MRISLIHATRLSIVPIESSFAQLWPEPDLQNLLDESLSEDLARNGKIDGRITGRLLALADYAVRSGADAILFTCSAFGPCIDEVSAELSPFPVRKPSEGMIVEAAQHGGRIGLVASFAPTLSTMTYEFPAAVEVLPVFATGALDALRRGDAAEHDRLVAQAAAEVQVELFALAQFSISRAATILAASTGKRVLTTPDSAVRELRRAMHDGHE